MGTHYDHLCAEERGTIMAMTQAGQGVREIARVLNRAASSISRERRRNGWHSDSERGAMGRPTIAGGYEYPKVEVIEVAAAGATLIKLMVATFKVRIQLLDSTMGKAQRTP